MAFKPLKPAWFQEMTSFISRHAHHGGSKSAATSGRPISSGSNTGRGRGQYFDANGPYAEVRAIPNTRLWVGVLVELAILVSTFLSMFISNLAIQAWYPFPILKAMAITNAQNIVAVEKALHFFWERDMQRWAIETFGNGRAWWWWNTYYAGVHAAVTVACMVLLLIRMLWWDAGLARRFSAIGGSTTTQRADRREFKQRREPHHQYHYLRTVFVISTALSTLGYILLPTMPPRLLNYCEDPALIPEALSEGACSSEYTYVDTIRQSGSLFWTWKDVKKSANPYAAFPSVHTLWSCFVAFSWIWIYGRYVHRQDKVASKVTIARHQFCRYVAVLYPMITVYCIIITANHYILDAIGGLVILVLSIYLAKWYHQRRSKRRIRTLQLTIHAHASSSSSHRAGTNGNGSDDNTDDDAVQYLGHSGNYADDDDIIDMAYIKPMEQQQQQQQRLKEDVFMA